MEEREIQAFVAFVESEPHAEDLSGVLLNRPAPQGGAFLISQRLPRALWEQMKRAGAWYYSHDDLEELDMFDSVPGWRYSLEALAVLLRAGYTLRVRGVTVQTVEGLHELFTPEACAAYHAAQAAQREEAQRQAEAQQQAERAARQAEAQRLQDWQREHLSGLVCTTIPVKALGDDWQTGETIRFTAGWYTTGNSYTPRTKGDVTVYSEYYGNATRLWMPAELADTLYPARWAQVLEWHEYTLGLRALWVLECAARAFCCLGDDLAAWAWRHFGEPELVRQAQAEAPYRMDYIYTTHYARASKLHRILFDATNRRGETMRGYGDAQSPACDDTRWRTDAEGQADRRLTGWVAEDDAESSPWWPSAEDRAQSEEQSRAFAANFSAMFSG
jgi:hypothetical protein